MAIAYCTKSYASCWDCELASRGKDCRGKSITMREVGARKSDKKSAASRENGKLGGRPRKQKITDNKK